MPGRVHHRSKKSCAAPRGCACSCHSGLWGGRAGQRDDNGLILYTPYYGIKKFDSLVTLKSQLEQRLNSATEDDRLLALAIVIG